MSDPVHHLDDLDFAATPWSWPFAENRRHEINEYFRQEREKNPALWNGRVLLLRKPRISGRTMSGDFFETDYASMIAALAWDAMDEDVKACFPAAVIVGSDGGVIAGEMAAHTRNAGQLLFPSGSIDDGDVARGRIDFAGAMRRELFEETGLEADALLPGAGWYAVLAGAKLPIIKILRSQEPAEALRRRIVTNLASQSRPEFSKISVVRDAADLSAQMPSWVVALLTELWRA